MGLLATQLISLALGGCGKEGCLTGKDDDCIVPPPCDNVVLTCDSDAVEMFVLAAGDPLPVGGPNALAAPGDIVLRNDHVVAVFDAIDHAHYISPSGGTLLDLAPRDGRDGLRNLFTATGLLPQDAIHYTEMRLIDEGTSKAVQFRGTLDGFPEIRVATRYELGPCDQGIRIRTEVVNRDPDPYPLFLVDVFYWGGREHLPFTPYAGFEHPSFGLTDIVDAIRSVPFMAGAAHAGGAASYGLAACDRDHVFGFQSQEISAVGPEKRILMPRDYEVFERYVSVAEGGSVSGPVDLLMEVRRHVLGNDYVQLNGRIIPEDGRPLGTAVGASIVAVGPSGPYSHAVPSENGAFTMRLPKGVYTLDVASFGMPAASVQADLSVGDLRLPDIVLPGVGEVTLTTSVDGVPDELQVFVYASDGEGAGVTGSLHGQTEDCAPLLGHPWGPSPACNRVLVNGATSVHLPEGIYDFYATAGPFTTMAAVERLIVDGGTAQSVLLEVQTLPLLPVGALSADFHVHGRASFDSSLPDLDRVRSFLATRVDVIASTDHDVVNDYAEAIATLGVADRMRLRVGLETTGHILFPLVEDTIFPKVIGHFNFWPMPYDPEGPWRGAPWDELAEPGELFTRVSDAGWPETGVIQLNHPWGGQQFGRDFAWPTAIGLDLTEPLPTAYDGTGQSLFLRTPPGARFGNADYHAQEVMNGTNNAAFAQYRAIWHYLLNQGVVRAGTANSDSHALTDNVLGTPRNIVYTDVTVENWDPVAFDAAVRQGRMVGTNGPVIEIGMADVSGASHGPSTVAFEPAADAMLTIKVSAAPWVPVQAVRVLVNGEVVQTFDDLPEPSDPFGEDGLVRFETSVPLRSNLPGTGDAWVVVEAGVPLVDNADLDCNGVPDTGDNNGDGRIDWQDVDDLDEPPEDACFDPASDAVGPLAEPAVPAPGTRGHLYERVTPGGQPQAFTNPLLLDLDGGGFGGSR